MAVKEYELLAAADARVDGESGAVHTVGIVPVYDATSTLPSRLLHGIVADNLHRLDAVAEPLPAALRVARRLPLRRDALAAMHAPRSEDEPRVARRRLAYEELLLLQLALIRRRRALDLAAPAQPLPAPGGAREALPRRAAVRAHRGPAPGHPRRRARPATHTADAPAPARRRRLGQDGRRRARARTRGRGRRAGRPDGAHRDARPAARRDAADAARAARPLDRADHRRDPGRRAPRAAAAPRLGRRADRGRHPRAARARGRVRPAARRGRGRAAPLRRRAARRPRRDARRARAVHDRDADPALARARAVRRPRRLRAARHAPGPPTRQHPSRARRQARRLLPLAEAPVVASTDARPT